MLFWAIVHMKTSNKYTVFLHWIEEFTYSWLTGVRCKCYLNNMVGPVALIDRLENREILLLQELHIATRFLSATGMVSWLTDKSIPMKGSNCPPIHIHMYIRTHLYTQKSKNSKNVKNRINPRTDTNKLIICFTFVSSTWFNQDKERVKIILP